MRNSIVARRYARALIEIGFRDGYMSRYMEELEKLRTYVHLHPHLGRIIRAPLLSRDRMKGIISLLVKEMGLSSTIHKFLNLLVDKARIRYLDDIIEIAHELDDEMRNVVRATVITACPLDEEILDRLRQSLRNFTGKNVIIRHKEDPFVIGGIIAQIEDTVLDYSIRTHLNRMREQLMRT